MSNAVQAGTDANGNPVYLDGKVVILSENVNGGVLVVEFPTIQDSIGNPQVITFAYGQDIDAVIAIAHALGL